MSHVFDLTAFQKPGAHGARCITTAMFSYSVFKFVVMEQMYLQCDLHKFTLLCIYLHHFDYDWIFKTVIFFIDYSV